MSDSNAGTLEFTPLHDLHVELGGRMVEFAGYSMPVQYAEGIVAEHQHTREKTGLFDVSHMGQVRIIGENHAQVATAIEKLVPGEIAGLDAGKTRYTQFTNHTGGILDDLMITRPSDPRQDGTLFLVINASRKSHDIELMRAALDSVVQLQPIDDRALLALQGPGSEAVLSKHNAGIAEMAFMSSASFEISGIDCWVSRSGYTGEDGFEISVPSTRATEFAQMLMDDEAVKPCGLGSRDSLRLEGGLCLYGNDIDETTSPVEAGLLWSISKRRRVEGGFPGADRIQSEISNGPTRKRVGIKPDGRAPARAGAEITSEDGTTIGSVTSGGFGPSIGAPIAMGYVPSEFSEMGTKLNLMVRGKALPATVVSLPFIPNNFKR